MEVTGLAGFLRAETTAGGVTADGFSRERHSTGAAARGTLGVGEPEFTVETTLCSVTLERLDSSSGESSESSESGEQESETTDDRE